MLMNNPLSKEAIFQLAGEQKLFAGALIKDEDTGLNTHTFETLNPFDHSVIGQVQSCDESHVNKAVRVARESFESGEWSKLHPSERKAAMQAWVALLTEHAEELAALDCIDGGKPRGEC